MTAETRWGTLRRRLGPGTLSLALGLLAWELIGHVWDVSFFPPFSRVAVRLYEMVLAGSIVENVGSSLLNLAIGFAVAAVGGVAIGVLMGASRRIEAALDVYVYALLTAPSLVFAPIFFSIFGLGRASIVAVVITYSIFIVIINTVAGVHGAPASEFEMARSFGASRWQLVRRVMLPAALPLILAGLRLGAGRAVKGMINGEMFIAVVGLGSVVMRAGERFDAESVLAVLVVITAIAFAVVWMVQAIDGRLTRWLPQTTREVQAGV